jgi:chloride channel protein, CIC family
MNKIRRYIIKPLRQKILNFSLRNSINEERTYLALTIITGVSSALVAVSLYKSIEFVKTISQTDRTFTFKSFCIGFLMIIISGWITTRKFPSTSGSGIPGVRVALAVFHGRIGFLDTIAKFIVSVLSLGSGVSLGREGPTAAISAGIGSSLGSFFHLPKKRIKALVAVGSAGGIAAAFNTPMAAVVFTLEEVVGDLNAKVLGSIIISSVVASVVGQFFLGTSTVFTELNYQLNNISEIPLYCSVGVISALFGSLWMKSVTTFRSISMNLFKGHRLSLISATFVTIALIGQVNHHVLGSGHGTIENALLSLFSDWKTLISLFALKFIATTISYGSGISGGLFMPTLLLGASLGGFIGSISQMIFPEISPNIGAFALIGMGAFFASVIKAPFTSILMIFELTRDYNIILPLMISNIISYAISLTIDKNSIYESISEQDGIHLPKKEDYEILDTFIVEEAMIKDVEFLYYDEKISDAYYKIQTNSISGFPVIKNNSLIGMVSSNEIAAAKIRSEFDQKTIECICMKKVIKIYPDQSLMYALHLLDKFHISRLPVVSRLDDKNITGIITANDITNRFGLHVAEEYSEQKKNS